jgi:hypothetical protein
MSRPPATGRNLEICKGQSACLRAERGKSRSVGDSPRLQARTAVTGGIK